LAEYIFEAFVVLACAGELIADLGETWLGDQRKRHLERRSTILLVAALSVSLICLVRTNELSGNVIGSLGNKADEADRKANTAIADSTTAVTVSGQALDTAKAANAAVGSAKAQAEHAVSDLHGLRKEAGPRRLTSEQKKKFTTFLEQYPDPVGIVIVSAAFDGESSDFADDFKSAIPPKWESLRVRERLTERTGISVGVLEGTPEFDPWKRSIAVLKKRVEDALTAIPVSYTDVTFGKDDVHSTNPAFAPGIIYLVVEHKPPIAVPNKK
jgi:hypothetical protein